MADKKSVGHAYNIDFLNVVFAASSLFLFASSLWMVWDDYDREWKGYQRQFVLLETEVTQANFAEAEGDVDRAQLEELRAALLEALELAQRGAFTIARADEDGHTALERFLTQRTAAGARIHTGRSRNDQVMAALRLYGREALTELQHSVLNLADALFAFAARYEHSPMPGRTHTQVAMPSTLGLWAAAFAEELLDDLALVATCYRLTNRSPLGSAAGYGAPLPLDREQVATLLGCDGPVHNVLTAAASSRPLPSTPSIRWP